VQYTKIVSEAGKNLLTKANFSLGETKHSKRAGTKALTLLALAATIAPRKDGTLSILK
jgi:hypothetical protein